MAAAGEQQIGLAVTVEIDGPTPTPATLETSAASGPATSSGPTPGAQKGAEPNSRP